ncbi:YihY/virulence factor BrkB family protein [Sphingomonas sp. BIUV-7]|uniref:YihY/virulence factor BrkB family protein n=1 Tax=Sphingomonas natans TaxID=3063330 RepID=A0ABT8YE97_9SPHN|nr:YihY/virulence factor BrkB family protein [Sphingomonas sp. BIUV-7]MDO6416690.1 YihY/virulence factor BrkB family protein [Sphingomonas sp. BIUV-7]
MVQPISPESPEERARRSAWDRSLDHLRPGARVYEILKRITIGVYSDGFIHAGNLAYLALVSLFPFFIVTAALAHLLGMGPDTIVAIDSFLRNLPRAVREMLRPAIADVLAQRTGGLLWLGGLVGLWTTGNFIETIRDILRRAYGVRYSKPFWHYRLSSAALILGSVMLTFIAFSVQLVLTGVEQFIYRLLPLAHGVLSWIGWSRLAPLATLFLALYLLFYSLTPSKYRDTPCPKWPGAAFTALWWILVTMALPAVLSLVGGYGLTYGSLAGVIVALLFFWLVGLGLVIGAQLNAALAEKPQSGLMGAEETVSTEE